MSSERRALNINLYTIIAVYFLILVGGIVRSTGAGMGCPDWPKCFDAYIPPTSESVLPSGYEQYYVEARVQKNARLANVLMGLGLEDFSNQVKNDPSITDITKYDVKKAWIEYLNRLVGVLIGLLIILNAFFSFTFWRMNGWVTGFAIISLVLVLIQGWFGSLVVSTNLLPGFISFHMILALVLVATLIAQRFLMTPDMIIVVDGKGAVLILMILFLGQIVLGVEVRESVDLVKSTLIDRSNWVDSLGSVFYIHRSYSLIILGLVGYLYWRNRIRIKNLIALQWLIIIIGIEIISGAIMAYFSIPALMQPIHLILGSLAFGVIFYLFLSSNFKQTYN